MEDLRDKLVQLLDKPQWSEEEYTWFINYVRTTDRKELEVLLHDQYLNDLLESKRSVLPFSNQILENIHSKMDEDESLKPSIKYPFKKWLALAASFIGIIFIGTWFYQYAGSDNSSKKNQSANFYKNDVSPGGNKALLTLADGSSIVLDSVSDGFIAQQSGSKIFKHKGKVAYAAQSKAVSSSYNTLSTPRGGQYKLELPDGTHVWLNSESSLKYPVAFTGQLREVEVRGEAYFEVSKNKEKPFIVRSRGTEVRVLGTHFNVMAYENEPVLKTTLLEGSVEFVSDQKRQRLHPGEQSQLTQEGRLKLVKNVDTQNIVAWKNGSFYFENSDLRSVMRQLSRWYDIRVVYKDHVEDLFFAEMPRSTNLSDVLRALELTGKVRFEIEGNTVTVSK